MTIFWSYTTSGQHRPRIWYERLVSLEPFAKYFGSSTHTKRMVREGCRLSLEGFDDLIRCRLVIDMDQFISLKIDKSTLQENQKPRMCDYILLAELDSGSGELILLVAVIEISQKRYSIDKFRTQLSSGTNEAEKAIRNCWKQICLRYSDVWFFPIAVVGGKIPSREFVETQRSPIRLRAVKFHGREIIRIGRCSNRFTDISKVKKLLSKGRSIN